MIHHWSVHAPKKPGRYWWKSSPDDDDPGVYNLVFKKRQTHGHAATVDDELTDAAGVQDMGSDDMPARYWGGLWWTGPLEPPR